MHKKYMRKVLIATILLVTSCISVEATTIPLNILQTIKAELPNSAIRFDGLVTLSNGTIYIPVIPSTLNKEGIGKVVTTYPANQKLSQLPEVVIFDTNYALLKVIKTKNGELTVTDTKNIPFTLKTGLFPQDMLVPPGLIIPDELKIMMGDLKIATKSSRVNDIFKPEKISKVESTDTKIVPTNAMKNKTLLATTLDSKILTVIPSDSKTPKFTLTLENLPKFVQPVCDDKYILVAAARKTYIDVADVDQEVLAKKIDLSFQPSEIILNKDKSKAYVSVADDQAIFLIDLKTMALVEKIKIKGYPKNITISDDDTTIAYQDKNTGDIYTLVLNENYSNKFVFNNGNVSKLLINKNNVYALSRTENSLLVIDTNIKDVIYKQQLPEKPIDIMLSDNKLYILSAIGKLSIFNLNDFSLNPIIELATNGFCKKMLKVPNSKSILITNITNKNYMVFDLEQNKVIQTVETPVYVNDLQIMNKKLK